jgi:chloramphenicol 3-O-phosphotransferase
MLGGNGRLVFVGGPAGAGKSTLARAWCATRERAVHLQLDHVRELIVAGRADPQQPGTLQGEQYAISVRACVAIARVFLRGGYDVAIDDVLEPAAFERDWRPALAALDWRLVIVLPSLTETLRRSAAREKRVQARHSRAQHAACAAWPAELRIDTSGLSVEASLALLELVLLRETARQERNGF